MTDEKLSAQEEAFLRGEPEAVAALEGPQSEIAPEPEAVKPEPERAVEPAAEPDADDPDDGMVPHGALAQARAKARQYREALAKAEQDRARLEGRLEALMKPSAPAEPEKPLKFSDDPMRVGEDLIKTTSEIRAELAAIKEQTALQHHMAALNQTLLGAEASYKSTTPDYDQAKIHARTSYFEELRAIGYDDETAFNTVVKREQQIVNNAISAGKNPAEVIYNLSKTRGWTGAKPTPAAPSPAEKVALAAKGQAADKSLGAAPGGAAAELSVEALAGMSDEDFSARFKGDKGEREFRRLFGG
jgi:hypothetical protein